MSNIRKFNLFALVLIVLVSGLCESFEFEENELASKGSVWKLYERWSKHHKISRDIKQKRSRLNVFKKNAKHVLKVNQMKKAYKLELNEFGDMSNSEFVKLYASSNISYYRNLYGTETEEGGSGFMYEQATNVPPSIDWRMKGAVNGIKSQARCGACWAFSAVAAVESIHQIRTKELLSLSEQEVIDCDRMDGGCGGGYMQSAFEFITQNGGIATEANYPYYAADGSCRSSETSSPIVTIDGYEGVPPNENALMQAVANQPVSVAISAEGDDFRFYSQGVFDGYCGRQLDHGVLAIGYGTSGEGTDYWLVKNSWGTGWGEGGYGRMKRGMNQPQGQCGIAASASYPIKY